MDGVLTLRGGCPGAVRVTMGMRVNGEVEVQETILSRKAR
jgi:hypothetical protein